MKIVLTVFLAAALIGVLVVLGMGVATLMKGGDPRRSNKLMQARVILQGLALLLLAALMLIGSR
jgi:Hypoxia induced protein conserved region